MPSAFFAKGMLDQIISSQTKERDRRETNTRDTIKFLIDSGRVRDYNDLMPLMDQLMSGSPRPMALGGGGLSKLGKGGGGKGGQQDPHTVLARFLNPAFKMQAEKDAAKAGGGGDVPGGPMTMGGQARPTFQGPAPQPGQPAGGEPQGFLMSESEVQGREDTAQQHKGDIAFGFEKPKLDEQAANEAKKLAIQHTSRMGEIAEANKSKRGSDLYQLITTKRAAFEEANGREPSAEEDAKLMTDARAEWQSAGRKQTDPEAYTKSWLDEARQAAPDGKLTPGQEKVERLRARKAWAAAGQSETGGDKLSRAKALASFKEGLSTFTPEDLDGLSQTVTIGGKPTRYLDTSGFTGKEKAKVMLQASRQGLVPVTAKQVEQLEQADAADKNITGFMEQIESKLPKDASGRPMGGGSNLLSKYFQTDDQLAAASAWDITVIPMVRAMAASGRILGSELTLAEHARPKLTDTIDVARDKVRTVQKILANGANPILTRGAPKIAGGADAQTGKGKADPTRRLRARQHLLEAQKAGKIPAGAKIDDATIDKWLEANQSFK